MKKMKSIKFLLLMLFAFVFGSGNVAFAQTDVTSKYLVNPSFENGYSRFLDINNDRGVEKPNGWSVEWYQAAADQNGMTFVAESMTQDNKTWGAKSGNAYFGRMRWQNSTLYLRQTMTNLLPGTYKLSFFATAHTGASGKNSLQVSVAGETTQVTVGSNEIGSWNDYYIEFVVSSNPYATIEIKADRNDNLFKFGIDDFVLIYDGSSFYESAISDATTLYDNNKDWAINADVLNAVIEESKGKESVEEKNEAIFALQTAVAAFKDANTVDVTSKIANPNFDSNISGWTTTGGDGNNFGYQTSSQTNFQGGFLEKWRNGWNGGYNQKNLDINQELSNLPNGEYTIKVAVIAQMQGNKEVFNSSTTYTNKKHGGPYYIDNEHGVWLYGESGGNSGSAWANTQNPSFTNGAGGEYKTATVKVENGNLKIGLKAIGSTNGGTDLGTYANWIACDNWSLSYFGFDPTTALNELAAQITAATFTDKHSVASETALQTAITAAQALVDAGTGTKAEIEEASANLTAAVEDVNASIVDYKSLATILSLANKYTVVAPDYTDLATAITTAQAVYDAATAESCEDAIAALDAAVKAAKVNDFMYVTGTEENPGTFRYKVELGDWNEVGPTGAKSEQHWSGINDKDHQYLEQSESAWAQDAWEIGYNQDISLPAGNYVFKVAGRKAVGENCTLVLVVKDAVTETVIGSVSDFPEGNTGLGINKAGVTSFDPDDGAGFAYDGKGRGFEWRYVKFTLDTDATVNIAVSASASAVQQWVSFCNATINTDNDANIAMIAYNVALNNANLAIDNDAYKNVIGAEKTALQTAINADMSGKTGEEIEDATEELITLTTAFSDAAPAYDKFVAYLAKVDNLDDAGQAAFNTAMGDAITAYEDNKVEASQLTGVKDAYIAAIKAQTTVGSDWTGLIVNPSFEESTDVWNNGWTTERNTTGNFDYKLYEETLNTNGTTDGKYVLNAWAQQINYIYVKQSINLPVGTYKLSAAVYSDKVKDQHVEAIANGVHYKSETVSNNVWETLEVEFVVSEESDVTIGIYSNGDNVSGNNNGWFRADNFKLSYVGEVPSIACDETLEVSADEATSQTFEVAWNNISEKKIELYSDADCTEAFTGDWFSAEIDETTSNVNYSISANESSKTRTVYMKLYGAEFGITAPVAKVVEVTQDEAAIPTYSIAPATEMANGSIEVVVNDESVEGAAEGAHVSVTCIADEGYVFDRMTIKDANEEIVGVSQTDENKFTFTMPASDLMVYAYFVSVGDINLVQSWNDGISEKKQYVREGDDVELDDVNLYSIATKATNYTVNVKYNRIFPTTNWQAWVAPFDLTITEDIDDAFEFGEIWDTQVDNKTGRTTAIEYVTVPVGGVVAANTPYFVRSKNTDLTDGGFEFEATSKLYSTESPASIYCATTKATYTFYCNYETLTELYNKYWAMGNGKVDFIKESESTAKLAPCRWYMLVTDRNGELVLPLGSESSAIKIRNAFGDDNDDADAISEIKSESVREGAYDLMGRKVSGLVKGNVYIINGKKALVK